jgi:class 3 adenylate cyclase
VTDLAELAELGLYDPAAPDADDRRALLEWLVAEGCTLDEMVQAHARGRLFALAGDRILRPGRDAYSLEEVAGKLDTEVALLHRIWRALGLADRGTATPVASPDDVEALRICAKVLIGFGEEEMLALARGYGAAAQRIANAEVSAARLSLDKVSLANTGSEAVTAREWRDAVAAVPAIGTLLDVVHRHHLESAMRHFELSDSDGLASRRLVRFGVGFVDLCGFTSLSQQIDADALAAYISMLEESATEVVNAKGGQVVKFLGDAVMFVAPHADEVADIATTIAATGVEVRGGLAFGELLAQDGDYFGPPVNLAARLAAAAEPGEVLASADLAGRLGAWCRAERRPPLNLRGYAEPVVPYALSRSPGGA